MVDRIFGLSSRAWVLVVVAGSVLGALVGLVGNLTAPNVFTARSLVVLTDANIPVEEFTEVARALLRTDTVLGPPISELGLDGTPAQLIANGTVSLEEQPSGLAVNVVARTSGADDAVSIANATAEQLTEVSELNGIGQVALFPAEGPATEQSDPLLGAVAIGALAGALITSTGVAIVLALQRRLLGSDGRHRFDAMVRADVEVAADGKKPPEVSSPYPLAAVLATLGERADGGDVVAVIVDAGRDLWASLAVADELTRLAEANGAVGGFRVLPEGDEPSQDDAAALVVIAADHTPGSRLRELRRSLRGRTATATMTLVLVQTSRGV